MSAEVRLALESRLFSSKLTPSDVLQQNRVADLRRPTEWHPGTRYLQRKIYLHVGPTNSGKTYQALKRLEAAETGLYAGPLRLLAQEVYTRLNARGKPCTLVTGDERKAPVGEEKETKLLSCTVEMVPINTPLDVAVIDEIQMLGHAERGSAWTTALLGVKAKEVHLCGEERTVPLIRQLCASMGDKLEVHHYKRLSPLRVMSHSLNGNLHGLQPGDCVVVFSRVGLYAMKEEIERKTTKRCAIVYGGLPPETRARQAQLFNDPNSGYDYLVATDAIGMGLNL
jgi:ATP-dependent RNA helicase SUPV3L1/SUV3